MENVFSPRHKNKSFTLVTELTAALVQAEIKLGLHILDITNMCSPFHIYATLI